MTRHRLVRRAALVLLCSLTTMNASCGDIVIDSVKTGLFSFVSGGLSYTLGGGQLNDYLTGIITGNPIGGTGT
jgi:hypothetical protein